MKASEITGPGYYWMRYRGAWSIIEVDTMHGGALVVVNEGESEDDPLTKFGTEFEFVGPLDEPQL